MFRILKAWAVAIFLLTGSYSAYASHIMGGSLTYKYVSSNQYTLEFTVYRDCNGIGMPTSVSYTIKGASSTASASGTINRTGSIVKVTGNSSPCATGYCIEKGIFSKTITMPGSDTVGYHVYYQDCCRNGSISNINN